MGLSVKRSARILDSIMLALIECGLPENVAFKGGYVLDRVLGTRGTVDIDMSVGNVDSFIMAKEALRRCGAELVHRGEVGSYRFKEVKTLESGRLELIDIDAVGVRLTTVDISLQRLDSGITVAELVINPIGMQAVHIRIPVYTYEKMLCDKVSATYSTKQFRRTKDLYDIYQILSRVDIDGGKFHLEMLNKGVVIGPELSPFRGEAIDIWIRAWKQFRAYDRFGNDQGLPELLEVMNIYSWFIKGYLENRNETNKGIWNHVERRWQQWR